GLLSGTSPFINPRDTNTEWEAIKSLIAILELFAKATDLLRGSKYTTVSFIYSAINMKTNSLILTDNLKLWEVNYKDNKSVFDNTNLNEDQTDNIKSINLQKQLNIPQDCTNFEER
ncbi:21040_t:CDS:1, partial [Racocetra persica]